MTTLEMYPFCEVKGSCSTVTLLDTRRSSVNLSIGKLSMSVHVWKYVSGRTIAMSRAVDTTREPREIMPSTVVVERRWTAMSAASLRTLTPFLAMSFQLMLLSLLWFGGRVAVKARSFGSLGGGRPSGHVHKDALVEGPEARWPWMLDWTFGNRACRMTSIAFLLAILRS